ncbi:hypothetical protein D3C78_1107620 [compost metagenome]
MLNRIRGAFKSDQLLALRVEQGQLVFIIRRELREADTELSHRLTIPVPLQQLHGSFVYLIRNVRWIDHLHLPVKAARTIVISPHTADRNDMAHISFAAAALTDKLCKLKQDNLDFLQYSVIARQRHHMANRLRGDLVGARRNRAVIDAIGNPPIQLRINIGIFAEFAAHQLLQLLERRTGQLADRLDPHSVEVPRHTAPDHEHLVDRKRPQRLG